MTVRLPPRTAPGRDIYSSEIKRIETASRDDDGSPGLSGTFAVCRNCETKASSSWSFCRNCEESLDDPLSPGEADFLDDDLPAFDSEEGCLECGHDSATIDDVATTGQGFWRLLDVQNRSFTVIVCDRAGVVYLLQNPVITSTSRYYF